MKIVSKVRLAAVLAACGISALAFAAGGYYDDEPATASAAGSIVISSPKDGAEINGQTKNELVFDVHPSPDGNHVHIYIDDRKPDVVHMFKGSYTLPAFSPGKHKICLREATVDHVLTGLAKCITVTAQ